tara:strand:- start:147 stop:1175 length:1029 start_codon:yes stop_codon:yes gene_type:complete
MKLGMMVGYSGGQMSINTDMVLEAERLGYDSVWTAEAYGSDAATPLAYIAAITERIKLGTAIFQMPARTPAMTAMTAMTIDGLSNGRFILGLGPSGPQVVEGWHGVPYGRPLTRTKEYIQIVRNILSREGPLEHRGFHYEIPFLGEGSTGLGKPLKSILRGRADIPIFTASIGPKGILCSGEVADGLLPVWMDPQKMNLIEPYIDEGFALRSDGKARESFRVAPFVTCILGDDLENCRTPIKGMLSLYIGGMGARGKNFYNDYARRMGYDAEADEIQDLYLAGDKIGAAKKVPDSLVDEVALVGSSDRIRDQVDRWRVKGISELLITANNKSALRVLAESVL